MPIDYSAYHPRWKKISLFIRKYRARDRCEFCSVKNREKILRGTYAGIDVYQDGDGEIFDAANSQRIGRDEIGAVGGKKYIEIVLTVAHLDHDRNNNSFFNLRALCQRCHLRLDHAQHRENARRTRAVRTGQIEMDL